MAEQRITQEKLLSITENDNAAARLTQEKLLSITENTDATARITIIKLLSITNDPALSVSGGANNQIIIIG